MLVDLARSTFGIEVLRSTLSDVELAAGDDDVGGVGCAGPVGAVRGCSEGVGGVGATIFDSPHSGRGPWWLAHPVVIVSYVAGQHYTGDIDGSEG